MPSKFRPKSRTKAQYIAHFEEGVENSLLNPYFEFPFVDWSGSKRTSELKPIGRPTITQHFGRNAKSITIEGNALSREKKYFQKLDDSNYVEIITDDYEGDVIITDIQMNRARGEHEIETDQYGTQLVYYYKLECVEKIDLPENNPTETLYPKTGPQ